VGKKGTKLEDLKISKNTPGLVVTMWRAAAYPSLLRAQHVCVCDVGARGSEAQGAEAAAHHQGRST